MSSQFVREFLPDRIDRNAAERPRLPTFLVARSPTDPSHGWREVTWKELANGVNRAAQYLSDLLGRTPAAQPTFAYVGPNDLRFVYITLGAIKAGRKALLISPRNSIDGQLALFEKADVEAFLLAEEHTLMLEPLLKVVKIPIHVVPSLQYFTDPTPVPHVPFVKEGSFLDIALTPILTLHTSGSTGIPKPVDIKHGTILSAASNFMRKSPDPEREIFHRSLVAADKILNPLPLFHAGGILYALIYCIYSDIALVLLPEGLPITADLIAKSIDISGAETALLAPAVVEDMTKTEEHIRALRKLDWFATGGGPVSFNCAETLLKEPEIHPINLLGSTECPSLAMLQTKRDEYPWFCFQLEMSGMEMRPSSIIDGEQLYEMWIRKLPGEHWYYQPVFFTFPDLEEFNTQDMFRKHPTKENYWSYYARSDDVIVFSNGEKLNPVDVEGALTALPKVKGAVVVGQARFQPALIVEPHSQPNSEEERLALMSEIWPTVQALNEKSVTHGRILRDLILLTDPSKPLPRAGKGTVQRPIANTLYRSEIDAVYNKLQHAKAGQLNLSVETENALVTSIVQAFQGGLKSHAKQITPDTDIFAAGVDSMQVLTLVRNLNATRDTSSFNIDTQSIYSNATPRRIAKAIFSQRRQENSNDHELRSDEGVLEEMLALVSRFTANLPKMHTPLPAPDNSAVLITGTTGALGPYLLADLLASPTSRIWAINRSPDAPQRQLEAHQDRGLTTDFSRVTFITSTLATPEFSIQSKTFKEMKESVGRIIHNAWPVNFRMPLGSFEPSIASVRHLIDFAASAILHPHITFVATVGTVSRAVSPIPEAPLALDTAILGYGQSKAVSADILDKARESGVASAVVRVGQIAGPVGQGVWNHREWFPSLVKSSVAIGVLPSSLGEKQARIDWLPVEGVAQVITGLSSRNASGYFHAVNPQSTGFETVLSGLKEWFGDRCKVVSWHEWLAKLEARAELVETESDVDSVPAVKILDFYRGQTSQKDLVLETKRTESVVGSIRDWGPVQKEWVLHWLAQWKY